MVTHTLRDNQGRDLTAQLEKLLPKITGEEKHEVGESLLGKLYRCKPGPGQIWVQLYLSEEENELFKILSKLVWDKAKPKPDEGNG